MKPDLSTEAAVRLMPDSAEAHYNYAASLPQHGKRMMRLSELRRVVQLKPDHVDAQLQLGRRAVCKK